MTRFTIIALTLILAAGCSQQLAEPSASTSSSVTPVAFNSSGAPTVQFTVPDMMCPEGCGEKVKEILSQQPGTKDVLVDFLNKTAIVAVDKEKFDATQAVAALKDHQFRNSAVKGGSAIESLTTTQNGAAR
jgi:copper chaperone CopZ